MVHGSWMALIQGFQKFNVATGRNQCQANKNQCRLAAKLMPHISKLKLQCLENLVAE